MRATSTMPRRMCATAALIVLCFLAGKLSPALLIPSQEAQAPTASAAASKAVGKVKSVAGSQIMLTPDAGADITVQVSDTTRLLRVEPGQKDLKSAATIQLQEIQPGDRLLVRGEPDAQGQPMVAATIVLMKAADLSAKQEHDRDEWKQHGVGGLVSAVDSANQIIAIAVTGVGANKTLKINATKETIVRQYAPDSIRFDDATISTLAQIKPGDQLRARGERNADGTELAALEIVFGAFRNIAGTVVSADATKSMLTVTDLSTKKPVTLTISADSQMRKLPPMVAQRIAMRLKGGPPDGGAAAGAGSATPAGTSKSSGGPPGGDAGGAGRSSGPPDFQQMLNRMPALNLADLQKGDAVMIVSTEGAGNTLPKAITLLGGVEPILTASPNTGQAAMLLSPWNLGGAGASDSGGGSNP